MPLDYSLQMGATVQAALAASVNVMTGQTQADVFLERLFITCNTQGALPGTISQRAAQVTDARVANQSLFVTNGVFPASALSPLSEVNKAAIIGVGLAAGTNVSATVVPIGGTADISASTGTSPVPAGVIPGEFALSQVALLAGLVQGQDAAGPAGVVAAGAAWTSTTTVTRPCRLGRMVWECDQNVEISSILISGAEQLASNVGAIYLSNFDMLATDEAGLSLGGIPVEAGSQIIISGTNNQAVATTFLMGGIFCF
jgi:hypothetical protein